MPGFKVPMLATVKQASPNSTFQIPYAKHIQWLRETKNLVLAEALAVTGVGADPFLTEELESYVGKNSRFLDSPIGHLNHPDSENGISPWTMHYSTSQDLLKMRRDDQGHIIGVNVKAPIISEQDKPKWRQNYWGATQQSIMEEERSWRQKRYAAELELLKHVDWKSFHEYPEAFIKKYKMVLGPESGILETRYPFAERLLQEATPEILANGDKGKIGHALREFFTYNASDNNFSDQADKFYIIQGYNESAFPARISHLIAKTADASHPIYQFMREHGQSFNFFNKQEFFADCRLVKPPYTAEQVLGTVPLDSKTVFSAPDIINSELTFNLETMVPELISPITTDNLLRIFNGFDRNYSLSQNIRELAIHHFLKDNPTTIDAETFATLIKARNTLKEGTTFGQTLKEGIDNHIFDYVQYRLDHSASAQEVIELYQYLSSESVLDRTPKLNQRLSDEATRIFHSDDYSAAQKQTWAGLLLQRGHPIFEKA